MPETTPLARSPIPPAPPVGVHGGWEISVRRSHADLRIADRTPLAKVLVRGDELAAAAAGLGMRRGRAARDEHGVLVVGTGPGEWLLLGPSGSAGHTVARMERGQDTGFHSVFDVTHGRALLRITGEASADVLAKVCAVDLHDSVAPDGAAFRSSVAQVVTEVVRDDRGGTRSYLLSCEWSSGQYLFDTLLDAGAEFGIDVDGF